MGTANVGRKVVKSTSRKGRERQRQERNASADGFDVPAHGVRRRSCFGTSKKRCTLTMCRSTVSCVRFEFEREGKARTYRTRGI